MTNDTMTADEAQRLLDGREAKGRWRSGSVEHEGKVWAHDPDALGGASVGEVCIFSANMHAPHNGNRALCAAAPKLAASVVALRAQLAQVTAERDALRARAELAEAERADALSEITRVIRECDVLREIVEGSTTPPSDEEIAAHEASSRGWWLFVLRGYPDVSTSPREALEWAQHHRAHPNIYGCRWWPLDTRGRPCAWPVVDR